MTAKIASTTEGASVSFAVLDAADRPVTGADIIARLRHPIDERRDIVMAVREIGSGNYAGRAPTAPGQWTLDIEVSKRGERLFRSMNRVTIE